jgi:hypothetical protein
MEHSEERLRDPMNRLLAVLLTVMSGAALAQTTGAVNPSPAPAKPLVKEDVPPGGCMPIGLTASGEIVFPILCKEFIERQRGKAVERKPAALEQKPAVEEKSAAKQSEEEVPEKPVIKPVETVPLPKRRERAASSDDGYGCQRYGSYDPASRTYTDYGGRRRPCR